MATKAEQIIDHFTQDADLKARILQAIAENGGKPDIDKIIAASTDDPALQAKIKNVYEKVRAGHAMHSLTGYHIADPAAAARSAEAISRHRGAVEYIMQS